MSHIAQRLTVGLIHKSVTDLVDLTTLTGLNKAECINRAIQLYAYIDMELANGHDLLIRDRGGNTEKVHLL